MEYKKLKDQIREIVGIASDVPGQFQVKCFEILLNSLVAGQQVPVRLPKSEVHTEKLEKVLAIDGEDVKILLKKIPGANKAQKTVNATLLYLYGKDLKDIQEVPTSEIRQVCRDHAILDKGNFATTLKNAKEQFIISGSGKSMTAKLTSPGKSKAKELIMDLQGE